MGLSDKLKDLRKQAETAVAEHKDQITGAVGSIGGAANQRTGGKYADKIAKVGDRFSSAVDKLGGDSGSGQGDPVSAAVEPEAEASEATEPGDGGAGHGAPDFR